MAAGGPDIGALLAQLGGGQGGPPGMGGPMMQPQQEQPEPSGGKDQVPALLKMALAAIRRATDLETEPIDKAELEKISTLIQQLFAQEQKEKDQAMGGSNMKLLRRNR